MSGNYHTHTISRNKHRNFLKQERRDSVTGELIKPGDKVVFCSCCKSAFLEDSWNYIGNKHCNQYGTLRHIRNERPVNMSKGARAAADTSKSRLLFLSNTASSRVAGILAAFVITPILSKVIASQLDLGDQLDREFWFLATLFIFMALYLLSTQMVYVFKIYDKEIQLHYPTRLRKRKEVIPYHKVEKIEVRMLIRKRFLRSPLLSIHIKYFKRKNVRLSDDLFEESAVRNRLFGALNNVSKHTDVQVKVYEEQDKAFIRTLQEQSSLNFAVREG